MRTDTVLSREQLEALGLLVGEFARLESTLDMLIMSLASLSSAQYAAFMRGKMLGAKLDVLKELGLQKLQSRRKRTLFTDLVDEAARLNGERTVAVHGLWKPKGEFTLGNITLGFNTGESEAVHRKGRLKAERLGQLVNKLYEAHSQLYRFWKNTWLDPRVRRSLRRNPPKKGGIR